MKRSQIVDLLEWHPSMVDGNPGGLLSRIEKVIKVAVEDEREACAKVCEELDVEGWRDAGWDMGTIDCAAAIRARGKSPLITPRGSMGEEV